MATRAAATTASVVPSVVAEEVACLEVACLEVARLEVARLEVACLEVADLKGLDTTEEWMAPVISGVAGSTVVADWVRAVAAALGSEQAMARSGKVAVAQRMSVASLGVGVVKKGRAEELMGSEAVGLAAERTGAALVAKAELEASAVAGNAQGVRRCGWRRTWRCTWQRWRKGSVAGKEPAAPERARVVSLVTRVTRVLGSVVEANAEEPTDSTGRHGRWLPALHRGDAQHRRCPASALRLDVHASI